MRPAPARRFRPVPRQPSLTSLKAVLVAPPPELSAPLAALSDSASRPLSSALCWLLLDLPVATCTSSSSQSADVSRGHSGPPYSCSPSRDRASGKQATGLRYGTEPAIMARCISAENNGSRAKKQPSAQNEAVSGSFTGGRSLSQDGSARSSRYENHSSPTKLCSESLQPKFFTSADVCAFSTCWNASNSWLSLYFRCLARFSASDCRRLRVSAEARRLLLERVCECCVPSPSPSLTSRKVMSWTCAKHARQNQLSSSSFPTSVDLQTAQTRPPAIRRAL